MNINKMVKVASSLKKRCPSCIFAIKKGILYIRCQKNLRHKIRQGTAK